MRIVNLEQLLPADLPPGERILWHGKPDAFGLARRAFRGDWVAIYFAALAAWNFISPAQTGDLYAAAVSLLRTCGIGAVALGIFLFLGWFSARTTLYVVTNRRVVMRVGMALPIFCNLPFKQIVAANVRGYADGTADIALSLTRDQRISLLTVWPHARPLRFAYPEPMLRCVPDGRAVARLLAEALVAASPETAGVKTPAPAAAPAPEPRRAATAAA